MNEAATAPLVFNQRLTVRVSLKQPRERSVKLQPHPQAPRRRPKADGVVPGRAYVAAGRQVQYGLQRVGADLDLSPLIDERGSPVHEIETVLQGNLKRVFGRQANRLDGDHFKTGLRRNQRQARDGLKELADPRRRPPQRRALSLVREAVAKRLQLGYRKVEAQFALLKVDQPLVQPHTIFAKLG